MVTNCLEFQLLFGSQLPIQVIPAWAQYFLSIWLGISAWTCKRAAFSASTFLFTQWALVSQKALGVLASITYTQRTYTQDLGKGSGIWYLYDDLWKQ
jgi:hypothetical protein